MCWQEQNIYRSVKLIALNRALNRLSSARSGTVHIGRVLFLAFVFVFVFVLKIDPTALNRSENDLPSSNRRSLVRARTRTREKNRPIFIVGSAFVRDLRHGQFLLGSALESAEPEIYRSENRPSMFRAREGQVQVPFRARSGLLFSPVWPVHKIHCEDEFRLGSATKSSAGAGNTMPGTDS